MEGVPLDVDQLDLAFFRTGMVNGYCTKFTYLSLQLLSWWTYLFYSSDSFWSLILYLHNSMEHSRSWKVNNCLAGHKISFIFWNIMFQYQVYRSLLLAHELEESSPCPSSLFLRYILILFIHKSSKWSLLFLHIFPTKNLYVWILHFPHVCHILHPSHGLDLITIVV